MKIELDKNEVELIITLVNDAAKGDFSLSGPPIYSEEEEALLEKLQDALSKSDNHGKKEPENEG